MAAAIASYREQPNYDAAVADFTRDLSLSPARQGEHYSTAQPIKDIDEEVKVVKRRKPIAKLDAERLLSERGVPELRRRVTKRLKFQGKGHEYTDMARLLNMYQMWLDDLYPRAKFRDGLSMVEKVGHTKRLQVMRRAWMDATRPTQTVEEAEADEQDKSAEDQPHNENPADAGDELDALFEESNQANKTAGDDEFDELDALMAEASADAAKQNQQHKPGDQDRDDQFADEEEAMAEMGDMW